MLFFSYVIETIKGGGGEKEPFRWKNLVNPGMISCVLAIAIYLSDIRFPFILDSAIRMVGSMTGPLAMMLLGSFLLDTDWKTLITYLLAVCMAALATPSGNVIPLLTNLYNKEGYPVSVQGVAVTTAAAVVTMPVVALVTGLG